MLRTVTVTATPIASPLPRIGRHLQVLDSSIIHGAARPELSEVLRMATLVDVRQRGPAEYGEHVFTIRFSSVNGTWSVPLSSTYSYDVGIEELPGISDLLLFPNPATEELGLRLNTDASRSLHLQVLDISGALVRDLPTWSVNGTASQSWYIGDLAPGTYQLRMLDGAHAGVLRFVKM